jgi:hypothetical protein
MLALDVHVPIQVGLGATLPSGAHGPWSARAAGMADKGHHAIDN